MELNSKTIMKINYMNKAGSNAAWNQLSAADRKQLEHWLMDDGLSLRQALAKARKQLRFTGSQASLQRFHFRLSQERLLSDFAESVADSQQINDAKISAAQLRDASLKVMAQLLMRKVVTEPDQPSQWAWLARLLLQGERNDIRRELGEKDLALRRERLALERESFEYDIAEAVGSVLPGIAGFNENGKSRQAPKLPYKTRIRAIRMKLFGAAPERVPAWNETPEQRAKREAEEKECVRVVEQMRANKARAAARNAVIKEAVAKFEAEERAAKAAAEKAAAEAKKNDTPEDQSSEEETDVENSAENEPAPVETTESPAAPQSPGLDTAQAPVGENLTL